MTRVTSDEIYHKIKNNGLLSKKRQQVYDILYVNGRLTGSQVAKIYKSHYPSAQHSESIRNRITELVGQGVVSEVGMTKCPITQNTVLLFETTNQLPVKLKKPETKKEKVKAALKMIVALGESVDEELKQPLLDIYYSVKAI